MKGLSTMNCITPHNEYANIRYAVFSYSNIKGYLCSKFSGHD
ncbi:hypothetical protein HMPREF6745_2453 [Prevotella sp. oral taxon 472 str. F0295]|nr:hypothetical protein HMPREF6745_2453 [Prevotella sp. oral taxon 472 str. F0295]